MGSPAAYPDDAVYLTREEFRDLPAAVQLAVWDAADAGLVGFTERSYGQPRRYHRAQVQALLAQAAGTGAG